MSSYFRSLIARIRSWFKRAKDEHEYEFALRETLVIATDLGRSGVVRDRRFDQLTNTEEYLIERASTGEREWYPRMSLCRSQDEAGAQPTQREVPLSAEDAAQLLARRP